MEEMYIYDYINKLVLLEKVAGHKATYKILDPFSINLEDKIISIQNAAKKVADFIGLNGFSFIVAIVKLKDKVAGNVELDYQNREVFIEISEETLKFNESILATLSHEISHKYIYLNGISVGKDIVKKYENEILTDITAVFLGLGKLMLNGCESKNVRKEYEFNGTKKITETLKVGYLNRAQLAFVYRLVCAMRKISERDMLSGLNYSAKLSVSDCDNFEDEYFNSKFHSKLYKSQLLINLKESIENLEKELIFVNDHLNFLQQNIIQDTIGFIKKKNELVRNYKENLTSIKNTQTYDPCLYYLNNINILNKVNQLNSTLEVEIENTIIKQKALTKITKLKQRKNKSLFSKVFSRRLQI